MKRPPITKTTDVTAEQLALAWRVMRKPPGFPPTLEQAMEDETRAKLLRLFAANLNRPGPTARPQGRPAAHSLPRPPAPPTPTQPPARGAQRAWDPRRAAANDLDDDKE